MKRQLVLLVAAVTCLGVSFAWSQDASTTSSSTSGSSSADSATTSPSTTSPATTTPATTSSSRTTLTSPTLFTNPNYGAWSDAGQSDSGQSGSSDPQNGGNDNTQVGAQGPQDTFSNPEKLPSLSMFSDAYAHTGVSLSTSVGSLFQHVDSSGVASWQTLSLFTGGLGIAQIRQKIRWSVGYTGGVNITTGFSLATYTTLNQSAGGNVTWDFARHWQLRAKDTFFYSDDPFQPFFTYLGSPTPNQPNPAVYFPQAIIEQNQGRIDLSHQLTAHDVINIGAAQSSQRYERVSDYTSLYNNYSWTGSGFYQHAISPQLAIGGGYQFQAIDSGHGTSRAGVQTLEGFVTYEFTPRIQASGWIGPQFTHTKDLIVIGCLPPYGCLVEEKHLSNFNIAEGGSFKWKIRSSDSFGLDLSHGVSDGGALFGVANIYSATATYNRVLKRSWILGVGALYNNNVSVAVYRASFYVKSLTGTVGVSRKLFNDAWNFNAYYAFIHQSQNYIGIPQLVTTHGVGVTLRYVWNFGLGR